MTTRRIGFVVNPQAGIGGPLGWHGSDSTPASRSVRYADGTRIAESQHAATRSLRVLRSLQDHLGDEPALREITIVTASGPMGSDSADQCGFPAEVVHRPARDFTTAEDTLQAARRILHANAELLLFVGGDGTARDICAAVGTSIPVVGVPSGVKMHSGVFGRTPEAAARVAVDQLRHRTSLGHAEVVDLDEDARERGDLSTRLFGELLVPASPEVQRGKAPSHNLVDDTRGMAAELSSQLQDGYAHVFGPGTTVQAVAAELGLSASLLGVDVAIGDSMHRDISADQLRSLVGSRPAQVIVSPIGGQGMVLGRGNQQIDAGLLATLDPSNLIILCTPAKLAALHGELYLDAPEPALNARFAGPRRVITGHRHHAVARLR